MGLSPEKPKMNGSTLSLWSVGLLTFIVISPVFLVEIPAMADYPNHLARMYLMAASGTPYENPYYVVDWDFYPNLAMDLIVPSLARFMEVSTATKTFLVLSQILVVSGAVGLEIVVQRQHRFSGFVAIMVLYSVPFAWGTLNYEFGIGLGLWGIASWLSFEKRSFFARLLVHSVFVIGLFISHLFALGVYGATLGLHELRRIFEENVSAKNAALNFAVLIGPVAIPLGFLLLMGTQVGYSRQESGTEWFALSKLLSVISAFNAYDSSVSIIILAAILALSYFLFRTHCLSLSPQGLWIAGGLLVLFLVMPFRVLGSAYADVRIVIAWLLIAPAFLIFAPSKQSMAAIPLVALSVIALLNAAYTAHVWFSLQSEFAAIRSSFTLIEDGSFVLIGDPREKRDSPMGLTDLTELPVRKVPVLAVHYARAFVPSLYAMPGVNPLRPRAEVRRLQVVDTHFIGAVPIGVLEAVSEDTELPVIPSHVQNWMEDYDYLYLVGPQLANPMPKRLKGLVSGHRFSLYRILKPNALP